MGRGVSPVIGVLVLVGIAVALSVSVSALVAVDQPEPAPVADLELDADAEENRLTVRHRGGDTLAVEELRVVVRIDGEPLAKQPPVPFFATEGFVSGPTGPFNAGGDTTWRAGEVAGVQLATTNDPAIDPGVTVTVTVATADGTIATLETTAQ